MTVLTFLVGLAVLPALILSAPSPGAIDCSDHDSLRTNAARLKCGLAPLKPTTRRIHSPHRPRSSPLYCAPVSGAFGYIQITGTSSATPAYVYDGFDTEDYTGFGLVNGADATDDAMVVTLPANMDPTLEPFSLTITNPPDDDYTLLGAATTSSAGQLADSGTSVALLTSVSQVPYENAPELSNDSSDPGTYIESMIWDYNCATGELTPAWINSNVAGGTVYPSLVLNGNLNNIFLTLDPVGYLGVNPNADIIQFFFTPLPP